MSRQRFIFPLVLVVLVLILGALYLNANLTASGGSRPVMPLDDAYIHFQYARAIADGHPFRYNPGQPPTSGATSLVYPFILALGYKIGFQAESLAWWALGFGWLCWLGSALLLYFTLLALGKRSHPSNSNDGLSPAGTSLFEPDTSVSGYLAFFLTIAFILTGSLDWAFMSGMETGLLIFCIFLTLYCCVLENRRAIIFAAALTALVRPEGLLIGLLAGIYAATLPSANRPSRLIKWLLCLALPLLAGLFQPAINLLVTGSLSATGLQAKSYFYNVPFDLSVALSQTVTTFLKSWAHLLWDASQPTITSQSILLLPLGVVALIIGLSQTVRTRRLALPALIFAWMLCITAVAATLETAFWQMGRYQQPAIALLFPLAMLGLLALRSWHYGKQIQWVAIGAILLQTVISAVPYLQYYNGNVYEVASSQLPMARYVSDNVPPDAVIGVHDIGVMRYLGNHTTYDVVGLTTPGAARAWRGGPGTTYEQMLTSPLRPSIFAIYPDARSLTYFQNTGVFQQTIAEFPSVLHEWYNVASATWSGQNVYQADWSTANLVSTPHQLNAIASRAFQFTIMDQLNVASLADEDAHAYQWQPVKRDGFASELRSMKYIFCTPLDQEEQGCPMMDGGRILRGESMHIKTPVANQDLLWVMRVHPLEAVDLEVRVNGQVVAYPHIFAQPGQWLEVATLIPASFITSADTQFSISIVGDSTQSAYLPFYHWFYQGFYQPDRAVDHPASPATFGTAITLAGRELSYDQPTRQLSLTLEWQHTEALGALRGIDAKLFVHLYDQQGKLMELPGAQYDGRLGSGTLPPANWLAGTNRDVVALTLPPDLPAGTYRVALGLYSPTGDLARLPVIGDGADQDRRLFIGEIEVK